MPKKNIEVVTMSELIGAYGNRKLKKDEVPIRGQARIKAILVELYSNGNVLATYEKSGEKYFIVEK